MTRLGYIDTNDPLEAKLYIKAQDLVSYIRAWKVHTKDDRTAHDRDKARYRYHTEEKCILHVLATLREVYAMGEAAAAIDQKTASPADRGKQGPD